MKTDRPYTSTRQRLVVLTFATPEDAERWDADKTWIVSGWTPEAVVTVTEAE